jgi:tRNA threonylcarbamoyladenosine biosynthesis protein TsaE
MRNEQLAKGPGLSIHSAFPIPQSAFGLVMTVLDLRECVLSWDSASAGETERVGQILGGLLRPGDVIALFGELGSGKTVLVRGIAAGLGYGAAEVHSPSFTLVNEYACGPGGRGTSPGQGDVRMAHLDLYRIRSDEELPGIGWDEYVHSRNVVAIEWADRALRWLPGDHLRIRLEILGQDTRRLCVQATGARSGELARKWVEAASVALRAT